jgi:hypothetical protein
VSILKEEGIEPLADTMFIFGSFEGRGIQRVVDLGPIYLLYLQKQLPAMRRIYSCRLTANDNHWMLACTTSHRRGRSSIWVRVLSNTKNNGTRSCNPETAAWSMPSNTVYCMLNKIVKSSTRNMPPHNFNDKWSRQRCSPFTERAAAPCCLLPSLCCLLSALCCLLSASNTLH